MAEQQEQQYRIVNRQKDGKIVEQLRFPISMTDEEISAILSKRYPPSNASQEPQQAQEPQKSGLVTDAKNFAKSAGIGLSDLPRGAAQAGVNLLAKGLGSQPVPQGAEQQQLFQNAVNNEFSRLYNEAQQTGQFVPQDLLFQTAQRNVEEQGIFNPVQGGIEGVRESLANTNERVDRQYQEMKEESPIASSLGRIGAGTAQGLGILGGAGTKMQVAKRGAGAGAIFGATAPSSEQQSAGEALIDSAGGAALGGAIGGVAPSVVRGTTKAVAGTIKNVTQPVRAFASKLSNPQIAKEAEELGIELGLDTLSNNTRFIRFKSLLKGSAGSSKLIDSSAKAINQIEEAMKNLANRASKKDVNATDVGEAVKARMLKKTDEFRANYRVRMDAFSETYNIKDDDLIATPNLEAMIKDKLQGISTTASQSIANNPAFQLAQKIVNSAKNNSVTPPPSVASNAGMLGMNSSQVAKQQAQQQAYNAALKNQLNYKSLKVLKKDFQDINFNTVLGGPDNALGKQLYGALSKDLEAYFGSKGDGALQAFKRNNKYYSQGMEKIAKITEKYKNKYNTDAIANNLLSSAKNGTTELSRVFRNIEEGDKDIMRAYFLRSLGRNSQGEFQIGNFLSAYNKISDKGVKSARDILFGKAGTSYRKDLDKIANIARQVNKSKRLDNTSRTADNLGNYALFAMGGTIGGPKGLALAYGVPRGISSLITSPKFARWIAKNADKPLNANVLAKSIQELQDIAKNNPAIATEITRFISLMAVLGST